MSIYAAYLRVSSDEQKDRQTIKTQLEAINNYARANKIKIKHFFADDGISGSIPVRKRPEGARLLEHAENGTFDTLLVFRIDRVSRDALEMLQTFKELESRGVTVKSITEPFETSDPVGRMVITMLGGMAQMEKEALISRSFAGMRRGAGDGRWMGGRTPFGYMVVDKKLEVCEAEAVIVREIFQRYLSGESTHSIANILNARNVPVPADWRGKNTNAKWADTTLQKILRKEIYIGIHRWNKLHSGTDNEGARVPRKAKREVEQIIIKSAPIISRMEFEAAQKRLDQNIRFSPRNAHREYTLRGLVKCGDCGFICTGGGKDFAEYSCRAAVRRVGRACNRPRIDARELESGVWLDLVELSKDPRKLLETLKQEHRQKHKLSNVKERQQEIDSLLEKKAQGRKRIIDFLSRELVSEDEAEQQLKELERDREVLESERDRLKNKAKAAERFDRFLSSISETLALIKKNEKKASDEKRGELIRGVVAQVVVSSPTNGNTELIVEIEYLLPDS